MKASGLGATEIAKALKIGRTSVYRVLEVTAKSGRETTRPLPAAITSKVAPIRGGCLGGQGIGAVL
jgi:DNA invertase Pin-like site-specific DNA recombinase